MDARSMKSSFDSDCVKCGGLVRRITRGSWSDLSTSLPVNLGRRRADRGSEIYTPNQIAMSGC